MRTKQLVLTALFAALTAIGAFLKIQIPVEGIPAITLQFFFTAMAGRGCSARNTARSRRRSMCCSALWGFRFLRWAADFLTCFSRVSAFCWG